MNAKGHHEHESGSDPPGAHGRARFKDGTFVFKPSQADCPKRSPPDRRRPLPMAPHRLYTNPYAHRSCSVSVVSR